MRRFLFVLLALLSPLAVAVDDSGTRTSRETFADLGMVTIVSPASGTPRDLLLVLDATPTVPAPLYNLARQGYLIAHIPLQQFLQRSGHDECLSAVTLLDVFSQHLQQEFRFLRYQRPLLLGLDSAAAFALGTLAQAPNGLFQVGFGVHYQPELPLPAPLCPAAGLTLDAIGPKENGAQLFRLGAVSTTTPWQALANLNALESALRARVAPAPASRSPIVSVADLPLVELPAPSHTDGSSTNTFVPADTFVVLLSGDGGWANIDKDIGETLQRAGLPVVGWNSLQYFWRKKSPEQASADLARVIAHYQQSWRRPKVLLIGFSLGADVLPFMLSRLPSASRLTVVDTVFLSLGREVDFEFHVSDWLGSNNAQARPIAPELTKLAGMPLLCIYGRADTDTLCAEHPRGLAVQQLPGDHHFDGKYQPVVQLILDHLAKTQKAAAGVH
jgi:type IV secretory pathway VirJ component